jgi:hypothetical protein
MLGILSLQAVEIYIVIIWTTYSLVGGYRRFAGTRCLHHHPDDIW